MATVLHTGRLAAPHKQPERDRTDPARGQQRCLLLQLRTAPAPAARSAARPGTAAARAPRAQHVFVPCSRERPWTPYTAMMGHSAAPFSRDPLYSPRDKPSAPQPQPPWRHWGKRLHCPIPLVSGPNAEQLLPSGPRHSSRGQALLWAGEPRPRAAPEAGLSRRCLPSSPGPSALLDLPPGLAAWPPGPSQLRAPQQRERGQVRGTGRAARCMHGWEPAPCASPDRRPRESGKF